MEKKELQDNTKRNNRKIFCVNLETLFDLAFKNAEQQISGDRLELKKGDMFFLHDQRNARKI